MQLDEGRRGALRAALGLVVLLLAMTVAGRARAQLATFDTTHTIFHESPTKTNMTVYTPSADLEVTPWNWLTVRGGWEADVVSGASIAVKAGAAYAANHPGADVVTAASVKDFRNNGHGGFTLRKDDVAWTFGYSYSTEHDYRSQALSVTAHTEAYEHNSQFEISYARNFDTVCNRVQSQTSLDSPVLYLALEDSNGCFTSSSPARTTNDIGIDSFQGTWSQSWTPILSTQLVYTAQITNGFQSNPYRSVVIAEGIEAQEHEPNNRAREALAGRVNFFIKPIKAALHFGLRAYYDTWDVKSGTGEAELEKYIGEPFRLSARFRYYKQSGAVFWSDDYTGGNAPLGPRGQYWTGDRELSPFSSWLLGLRAVFMLSPQKRILGVMSGLRAGLTGDVVTFSYDEYTLGGAPVTNARAYIGAFDLTALF